MEEEVGRYNNHHRYLPQKEEPNDSAVFLELDHSNLRRLCFYLPQKAHVMGEKSCQPTAC